jgi:predicted 3-demethylubiquinone-9 3-methyltransferase (glyoxalase superfamily)
MQKITPFLWFDGTLDEAFSTYASLFKDGEITERVTLENHGPDGDSTITLGAVRLAGFEIRGGDFGSGFSITPAISFMVECESADDVDTLWNALIEGGFALMELGEYPFSRHYGWLQDRFGVNWQFSQADSPQKITPSLLYVGDQFGRAEEAMKLYTQVFDDSSIGDIFRGEKGQVSYGPFTIAGQEFIAMEDDSDHQFTFTEGLSLYVDCADQAEVDRYWNALTANGGEESQCGWLKDPFGVSWQIIPRRLTDLTVDPDKEKAARVTQAMLQMQKIEVDKLEEAANAV